MDLAIETIAYQAQLEASRVAWAGCLLPVEELELIDEDLAKAKQALDIAYLEHTTGGLG